MWVEHHMETTTRIAERSIKKDGIMEDNLDDYLILTPNGGSK